VTKNSPAALEHSLRDAQAQLESAESRREVLASEHSRAVESVRAQSLNGRPDRQAWERAVARKCAVEDQLKVVDEALGDLRGVVARRRDELRDARDKQQRETKAAEAESHAAAVEREFSTLEPLMARFVATCRTAAQYAPEAEALARWFEEHLTASRAEVPHVAAIMIGQARLLRAPPSRPAPQPVMPEVVPPTPGGQVFHSHVGVRDVITTPEWPQR
jgi:hypothetical protein